MRSEIIIGKITSNPEVTNAFWIQICELKEAITIDKKQKDELLGIVLEVMKKLESVNYHRTNLLRIIEEQLEELLSRQVWIEQLVLKKNSKHSCCKVRQLWMCWLRSWRLFVILSCKHMVIVVNVYSRH